LALSLLLAARLAISAAPPGAAITGKQTSSLATYALQTYGTRDGLPSAYVSGMLQDAEGFLWMTTPEGLVRYDGAQFTTFDRRTAPALNSNAIGNVALGPGGRMVFSTSKGALYRIDGGEVAEVRLPAPLPHPEAVALQRGAGDDFWIGSRGGLCRVRGSRMTCFGVRDGLPAEWMAGATSVSAWQALATDRAGRLWAATIGGLARQRGEGFEQVPLAEEERAVALKRDAAGTLWVGTTQGRIGHLDDAGFHLVLDVGRPTIVTTLAPSSAGELFFGTTTAGIGRWDGSRIEWLDRAGGLPGNEVLSLLADREGFLWVGTTLGLARLSDALVAQYGERHGLSGQMVVGIAPGKRGVWVTTNEGGLQLFDGQRFTRPELPPGGPRESVRRVVETRDGTLWLGTREGLYRLSAGRFEEQEALRGFGVVSLLEGRGGKLWVGTVTGGLFGQEGGGWKRWSVAEGLPDPRVYTVLESRDGGLWIGTPRGLARLFGGRLQTWDASAGLPDPLVVSLHEDERGVLWIGTVNEGVVRFQSGRFVAASEKAGFPDDTVWSIVPDRFGYLWSSSNRGISRIARAELDAFARGEIAALSTPVRYGPSDGLLEPDCIGGFLSSAAVTPAGWLCFATTGGLAVVRDPSRATLLPAPPRITLLSFRVDGEPQRLGDSVSVPPGSRRLQASMAAPTFRSPERLRFRHRLVGFDDSWLEIGASRDVLYTNPPVGHLTLEAATSRDGRTWSEPVRLAIDVLPRWFETVWFRGLALLALVVVGPGFYRFRMRQAERREAALQAVVAERTEELSRANAALGEKNALLAELSISDPLTGLANRRRFDEALAEEWRRAARARGWLSLLTIDIDQFKQLNDASGHPAGDVCLRAVAQALRSLPRRAGELVARVGGEEFSLLLPGSAPEDAAAFAETLRAAVEGLAYPHPSSGVSAVVTVSCGAASARPDPTVEPEALPRAADEALYEAKRTGRNRVAVRLI